MNAVAFAAGVACCRLSVTVTIVLALLELVDQLLDLECGDRVKRGRALCAPPSIRGQPLRSVPGRKSTVLSATAAPRISIQDSAGRPRLSRARCDPSNMPADATACAPLGPAYELHSHQPTRTPCQLHSACLENLWNDRCSAVARLSIDDRDKSEVESDVETDFNWRLIVERSADGSFGQIRLWTKVPGTADHGVQSLSGLICRHLPNCSQPSFR